MQYNFRNIEQQWQKHWKDTLAFQVSNESSKPPFYVLDMFPYPSGAGLHVGHPLGYIASDIFSRYKRLKGFNVLHPMGFDSFGLPAEQYALETGQHPAATTEKNIATFKDQLDKIGFSYDWSREVRTSDPNYYRWTQYIFLQLFKSWYDHKSGKAEPIATLSELFEQSGTNSLQRLPSTGNFTADEWENFSNEKKEEVLMEYRLAYSSFGEVNWCEGLGTVLANDEVVNGVSERGGFPVVKKKMRQWYMRITEYADRLLQGLEKVDFSESMKEMQRNWIGRSEGAEVVFRLTPNPSPEGEGLRQPFQTANNDSWPNLKDSSRENRKGQTVAEDKLWQKLRSNQLGAKVRRQHVIDNFIIDFAFLNEKLLIEVDGDYHNDEDQKKYDFARESYLKEIGYKVLRFTNSEVNDNVDSVVDRIRKEVASNAPLSPGRGAGGEATIIVYTTRPDTLFGVDFLVLAPEHELVQIITSVAQRQAIDEYLHYVKSRSDRERMSEVKQITGCFTGAYALHPFNGNKIPVWIAEYVLAGYGTGAIMAVPCGDQRDFLFAKHFNIPITNIIGEHYNGDEANPTKEAILSNSGFLDGLLMKEAITVATDRIVEEGIGKKKINYRMRDAGFSRQRYWGEPFPVIWKDGVAVPMNEKDLPLELPHIEKYGPGPEGEGPLANITEWVSQPDGGMRETSTMPGYAGSSWYFLRYMDPNNADNFCERKISDYWGQVDVYVGGTEHAVGHLLYSRMWTKFLYDRGWIGFDEPFKKLVNQGMITGKSYFFKLKIEPVRDAMPQKTSIVSEKSADGIYKIDDATTFTERLHIRFKHGHNYIEGNGKLTKDKLEKYLSDFKLDSLDHPVIWEKEGEEESILLKEESEKMSKSKFNVDNPDDIVEKYGADTFRMYEMFLGPVEQSKPWDTKGIEGVHRFLRKLWRLFNDDIKGRVWNEDKASDAELKVLHKTIKKIEYDTETFSFNTAVSAFMVAVNELSDLNCHKKEILQPLLILLVPYAPHISEELWHQLGNTTSVLDATFPSVEEKYLVESSKEYPVSVNGKLRTTINMSLDVAQVDVEKTVLANEIVQKWLEGKPPKKIIFVKGKMINVVI